MPAIPPLTSWIDAHPEWESDWTKQHAIAVVHRPFNWAAKQRLIAANPFRGVTHRAGNPRRPMTDAEFEALLVAADGRHKGAVSRYPSGRKICPSDHNRRKSVSAADRFRELLRFLRLTGARPGEASHLEWSNINLETAMIVLTVHKRLLKKSLLALQGLMATPLLRPLVFRLFRARGC